MSIIVRCRFCRENSLGHDHDDCAKKYGEGLKRRMTDHFEKDPTAKLPDEIREEMQGDKWKWYLEYKDRKRKEEERTTAIKKLKEKAKTEVEKIIKGKKDEIDDLAKKSKLNVSLRIGIEVFVEESYH